MVRVVVITTTFASQEQAAPVLRKLVEERLVACAHLNRISSHYRWESNVVCEEEWRASLKTSSAVCDAAISRLCDLHPYEVPMILSREEDASEEYGAWVVAETER